MAMTYLYLKGSHLAGISIMPINVLHQIIQKMYFSLPKTFMNIQALDILRVLEKGLIKKYMYCFYFTLCQNFKNYNQKFQNIEME